MRKQACQRYYFWAASPGQRKPKAQTCRDLHPPSPTLCAQHQCVGLVLVEGTWIDRPHVVHRRWPNRRSRTTPQVVEHPPWRRPQHEPRPAGAIRLDAPIFNMAVALSIRASLERLRPPHAAKAKVQIKWPNDILISQDGSDRKCAGILVENVWRGASWSATVLGVGVNVNSNRLTSPFHATSLRDAWGISMQTHGGGPTLGPRPVGTTWPTPCTRLHVARVQGAPVWTGRIAVFRCGRPDEKGRVVRCRRTRPGEILLGRPRPGRMASIRRREWRFEDAGQNRD